MVDDDPATTNEVAHFDINELAKAEKVLQKNKKRRKLSAREKAAVEAKERDAFEMDVGDPRFEALYERSEFAIDPTSARFRGTEGMRALLEEGRKRKRERGGREGDGEEEGGMERGVEGWGGRKAGGVGEGEGEGEGDELRRLVERVKGKTKKKDRRSG